MRASDTQFQPVSVLKLRDHIEQQVRDAILNGTLRPGQRVVETTIADQLGVSRAPVREVLSALEREGLVVNIPRRGSFVVDFSDKDIEEIYSLRLLLEIGALRRAIGRFAESDLLEIQGIVDQLGELTMLGRDQAAQVGLDLAFHEAICRLADHGRLYSVWNSMRLQTQLLIGLTNPTHQAHPEEPREYHQAILNAIRAKELARAESLLTLHIVDAQQRASDAMRLLRAGDLANA